MDKFETLRKYYGHHSFRPGQEALIDALLERRDALGVMPTGAGKSVCYQIPAIMSAGTALVISPLISLMNDQVMALRANGIAGAYINSSLTQTQQALALSRAAAGAYKIIYVAPERLETAEFLAFARDARISLVAVDEAHCVSQWGQDFRPSYLGIADFIDSLPTRPPVGAFTATATAAVRRDIALLLRLKSPVAVNTGFDRPNLRFASLKPSDKYASLLDIIDRHPDTPGIVYCSTRKAVDEVSSRLLSAGYSATRYHAGLSDEERRRNQEDFQFDRRQIMVATNAFGMGIDKPNVSFVAHYNMPKDLESYYQEAGRAGRDGSPAECVLLYGGQDVILNKFLINHSEESVGLSAAELALKRQRDMDRLRQMTFYATSKKCLRAFILSYFGERAARECGNCSVCLGEAFAVANKARAPLKKKPLPQDYANANAALYARLRETRRALAAQKRVPAYVIFQDSVLREMAARMPASEDEMLEISGIGSVKLKKYGEAFLDVIREYME